MTLDNPKYKEIIANYSHIEGITIVDKDEKERLPVHLILRTGDYSKIKTLQSQGLGLPASLSLNSQSLAGQLCPPGEEVRLNIMFLTQVHREDYEQLCRVDVLDLQHSATGDQQNVFKEFKEQLTRSEEGWYETSPLGREIIPRCIATRPEVCDD